MSKQIPNLNLTHELHQEIAKGFGAIREVLKKKNVNIENVIGLVTSDEVAQAGEQVRIKFAEETAAHMNMIAFD